MTTGYSFCIVTIRRPFTMDILNGPCKLLSDILTKLNAHAGTMGLNIFEHDYKVTNRSFKVFMVNYALYTTITFTTLAEILGDFLSTAHWTATLGFFIQVRNCEVLTLLHSPVTFSSVCRKARRFPRLSR